MDSPLQHPLHTPSKQSWNLSNWNLIGATVAPISWTPEPSPHTEAKTSPTPSACTPCPVSFVYRPHENCSAIKLFFKKTSKEKQQECSKIPLRDYGIAFEDENQRIVILQLLEEKLSCHLFDTDKNCLDNKPPMHISHRYDQESDSLMIYLIDRDLCKGRKKFSVVAHKEMYDMDLVLNCDQDGKIFAISILNASELLPIEEFPKND